MKQYKRFVGFLVAFWMILSSTFVCLPCSADSDTAQEVIDGILAQHLSAAGVATVQHWINGALCADAGVSAEWYVIAVNQYGRYDTERYEAALLRYLSENTVNSASSRQKYALALISCGSTDVYIDRTLNDSIGRQGVMSWIYGLHLLSNGYQSREYAVDTVVERLLSLQLADGGWAVTGTNGDVDVTAMAIQALSVHRRGNTAVIEAIDRALSFLSDRQKDSGEYSSYGVNNSESAAQVLIALSSLGVDCQTDRRFIKNGHTLFDAILSYRLSDGSFCHKQDGVSNGTATAQVLNAMVAYMRMTQGKRGLYCLDRADPDGLMTENAVVSPTTAHIDSLFDTAATTPSASTNMCNDGAKGSSVIPIYKWWIAGGVIVTAAGLGFVTVLVKKGNRRNVFAIVLATVAAVALIFTIDIQSPEEYYGTQETPDKSIVGTVTLTVRCDAISDHRASHIPDDGIILNVTAFDMEEGATVYDVLSKAAKMHRFHLEIASGGGGAYIKGIANIYEFDFGDLSGWMYCVNGELPSVGCSEYVLSDGDHIEVLYTCNMGQD